MKTNAKTKISALLLLLTMVPACTSPKNGPRDVNDAKVEWKATKTPVDSTVGAKAFQDFDMKAATKALNDPNADITSTILVPLSDIVLNGKFIGDPAYNTIRMSQLLQIFHQAMLHQMDKNDASAKFKAIKSKYFDTVFAGCTRDLKSDCVNAALFATDTRLARIMTVFARDLDSKIEAELKANKTSELCVEQSATCRDLLETRYRILAMALFHKSNRNDDQEYTFAYLKYARPFALLMDYEKRERAKPSADGSPKADDISLSYLSETHGKIFETLIAKYAPTDLNNKEFRAFVENFNPWVYSKKKADLFQYGTRTMFELGAKCCLYVDQSKTVLSPAVTNAIKEAQLNKDEFGPTVQEMVKGIRDQYGDRLFKNLGILELTEKVKNSDPAFYNEFFFIVDRLFRENLSSAEVEMVLANVNPERAKTELPNMISSYIKLYMAYMIVETNKFMKTIYESDVSSGEVFNTALTRSRELTARWHKIQAQIDLLDGLMGSYFKSRGTEPKEYVTAVKLISSVDRNIHYLSVYPNMVVMTYFLAKMDGTITVNTWWGRVEIQASTILQSFFDGAVTDPWFRFGKDVEPMSREMLLYSMEFLLSTETLSSFVAKDLAGTNPGGSDRSKFLDLIISKYLEANTRDLSTKVLAYERSTVSDPSFGLVNQICGYELQPKVSGLSPRIEVNFSELNRYTYSGLGDNSLNSVLNKFLGQAADSAQEIRGTAEKRITYVKAILEVVEADLIRSGKIQKAGDPHPDTAKARAIIQDLEALKTRVAKLFVQNHKRYYSCLTTLQEVERRRVNRLYDEERAHLGRIYDMLVPLSAIQESATLDTEVAKLNQDYFRNSQNGYRFDRLDGLSYRMSQYDLLMRMKKRIESDIFTQATASEVQTYGETLKTFEKPRSVLVNMPAGLEREEMVSKGTSITLYFRGDRQEFIRQGMKALNGKSDSFIQWQGQMSNDKEAFSYISSLEEFYLLGPIKDGATTYEVTKEDLTKAYVDVMAGLTMDSFDIANAQDFNIDGRFPKSFYEGRLFQKDGQTRLPFFRRLMIDIYESGAIKIGSQGPINEALDFASAINNLGAWVFEPAKVSGTDKGQVPTIVHNLYGARARRSYNRVSELYSYLQKLESSQPDISGLDSRLARPFYISDGTPLKWREEGSKNFFDQQVMDDLKVSATIFGNKTNGFYKKSGDEAVAK